MIMPNASILRLSVRDLLWLTLVVALSIAWWIQNRQLNILQERFHSIIAELASRDLSVEIDNGGVWISTPPTDDNQ